MAPEHPEYHMVSFSGGKDSTAMLLRMIELGYRIDEVVNFDTGVEFPSMYEHIENVRKVLDEHGIKFSVFRSEYTFEHFLLERERESATNVIINGWGWPSINNRWCTANLKTRNMEQYLKDLSQSYTVIQYLGIAMDESKRLERDHHKKGKFRYPLVEWGWTEKDCLKFCYENGYDWGGLYRIFNRVSCWLCPLQKISELYKLWENFPELWNQLRIWDEKLVEQYGSDTYRFKGDYRVSELEKRFVIEQKRKRNNITIKSKNFYKELELARNGVPKGQTKLEVF